MIIDVRTTYQATVRKRRARQAVKALVALDVQVQVAECAAADLPVVARYAQPVDAYARDGEAYDNVLGWHAGGLVEPLRIFRDGVRDEVRRDGAWLSRVAGERQRSHDDGEALGDPFEEGKRWARGEILGDADIAEAPPEAEAARERAVAATRAKASALVLVDGTVWRPVGEPRLVSDVTLDRATDTLVLSAVVMPAWRFDGKDHRLRASSTYRLDQVDTLLAMHEPLLAGRGAVARMPSVAVERPDLLRYAAGQEALAEAGASRLESLERWLKSMPVDGLVAYAALRDAMPGYLGALAKGEATDDERMAALLAATSPESHDATVHSALRRHALAGGGAAHMASFSP